jgi:hypothetical protein
VLITKAALDGLRDKAVKVNSEKKPKTEKKAEKK